MREERLEAAVWQAAEEKLLDADLLCDELAQLRATVTETSASYTQRLEAVADVQRKLRILLDHSAAGRRLHQHYGRGSPAAAAHAASVVDPDSLAGPLVASSPTVAENRQFVLWLS